MFIERVALTSQSPPRLRTLGRDSLIVSIDPPPTHIYTLSLHDALPICSPATTRASPRCWTRPAWTASSSAIRSAWCCRSEEHTSELQSPDQLVCRLLLEKQTTAYVGSRLCKVLVRPTPVIPRILGAYVR